MTPFREFRLWLMMEAQKEGGVNLLDFSRRFEEQFRLMALPPSHVKRSGPKCVTILLSASQNLGLSEQVMEDGTCQITGVLVRDHDLLSQIFPDRPAPFLFEKCTDATYKIP